jgi:hypothetical protein
MWTPREPNAPRLDQLEIQPALALRVERDATPDQHRVDKVDEEHPRPAPAAETGLSPAARRATPPGSTVG